MDLESDTLLVSGIVSFSDPLTRGRERGTVEKDGGATLKIEVEDTPDLVGPWRPLSGTATINYSGRQEPTPGARIPARAAHHLYIEELRAMDMIPEEAQIHGKLIEV
ncbi:MAG: hypothetical protein HP495_14725, partial [Nitrospira sp.]|nr:hypothetical protein [Nitrospira sp.]